MGYEHIGYWIGFTVFIVAMLALDLGFFQRRPHVISMKEALGWFAFWVGLALLFNIGIIFFHERGLEAGLEFFTGFLVEKSLSIDNIFVFILIFSYFRLPAAYQHKVLFSGIVGAIILRLLFIVAGISLFARFHWMIYVFGFFLVATGVSMLKKKDVGMEPQKNWIVRGFRRIFPFSERYEGGRFFFRKNGKILATPLFLILLTIESSDIIFAADSIPAIFAITPDPFIVYTSNIFALLGLRALYFAVSGFMRMFHFLHYGFASIILVLGVKMLLSGVYEVPAVVPLVLIVNILLLSVIVSLLRPRREDMKLMLGRTERLGLIPFRRLLLIENIIDLGKLKVRDAMCRDCDLQIVRLDIPWEQNLRVIQATRFSRYPLVERSGAKPLGIIHIKDLFSAYLTSDIRPEQLRKLARRAPEFRDELSLEEALARFQALYYHMAVVINAQGQWMGIITIEDVLEELVGKIDDEFDAERAGRGVSLADALGPSRVFFELSAVSMQDAVRQIVDRIPGHELAAEQRAATRGLLERTRSGSFYLGRGVTVLYSLLDGITAPLLAFARSDEGVPLETTNERAELIFLLLTPTSMGRYQPRLLAEIGDLFESEYVSDRLRKAVAPEEVIAAIRAGQEVAID